MSFQFHPLALGVMLLVAAGTVVYTILNLNANTQRHYHYDNPNTSTRSGRSDVYIRTPEDSEDENEIRKRIENCSICLRHLKGRALRQLRCKHEFHEHCINMWLNNHNTCPNCRKTCI